MTISPPPIDSSPKNTAVQAKFRAICTAQVTVGAVRVVARQASHPGDGDHGVEDGPDDPERRTRPVASTAVE